MLRRLNVKQLRSIAKDQKIKNFSKLKKDELIELLRDVEIEEESIPNPYNCHHDKYKYRCKECGGNKICEHGRDILLYRM